MKKSQGFLNVVREIINDKVSSCADQILYSLLLSVRVHSDVAPFLLNICDEMQNEVLKMIVEEEKSEKRE